jgi:hypothetical protein
MRQRVDVRGFTAHCRRMSTEHSIRPTVWLIGDCFALLCFALLCFALHTVPTAVSHCVRVHLQDVPSLLGHPLAQVHCLDDPSEPHVAFTRNIHETVTSVELGFVSNAQSVPFLSSLRCAASRAVVLLAAVVRLHCGVQCCCARRLRLRRAVHCCAML